MRATFRSEAASARWRVARSSAMLWAVMSPLRVLVWLWERFRTDRVTFLCGGRTHTLTLRYSDFLAAGVLHDEPFYGMFCGSGEHARQAILRAAEAFLAAVRRDFELLRCEYGFEGPAMVPGVLGPLSLGGATALLAVEIGGRRYCLQGGTGQCALMDMREDADGVPAFRRVRDLRREQTIDTDAHGTITIVRRRKNLRLAEEVESLVEFLRRCDGTTVQVRVSWDESGMSDEW